MQLVTLYYLGWFNRKNPVSFLHCLMYWSIGSGFFLSSTRNSTSHFASWPLMADMCRLSARVSDISTHWHLFGFFKRYWTTALLFSFWWHWFAFIHRILDISFGSLNKQMSRIDNKGGFESCKAKFVVTETEYLCEPMWSIRWVRKLYGQT